MKTIVVKGEGRSRKKAEKCIVYFEMKKIGRVYEEAISTLNNAIYETIGALEGIGIKSSSMKTLDFSVAPISLYKEHSRIAQIEEYKVKHKIGIEIENSGRNINSIIEVLVKGGHTPKVWIDFIIDGEEQLREEALVRAIVDGKNKGEIILKTLGSKIFSIKEVNYAGTEQRNSTVVGDSGEYNFNKVFEDVEIKESIEIVFEIK